MLMRLHARKGNCMRKIALLILVTILSCSPAAQSDLLKDLEGGALDLLESNRSAGAPLDSKTIIAGLKEALSLGVNNGIKFVSQLDGFFGNKLIKILIPEKIQNIADVLRKAGFRKEVEQFELSMNRAAEKAAPKARAFFLDAIQTMTIQDAQAILRGNDTAATEYLKLKTRDRLYGAFKPVVASAMRDVGVTRSFQELMDKARTIPLLKEQTVDLDHHVTTEALDGLFFMIGEEEKKIRKDPAARVTSLLKKVFQ
jgi:hypothetical protein